MEKQIARFSISPGMARYWPYCGRPLSVFLLVFLFSCSGHAAHTDAVQVVTVNYPPYSYNAVHSQQGYATELVRRLLQQLGSEASIREYPYKRALKMASDRDNVLVYPLAKTAKNTENFHWIGKIADRRVAFFRKKGRADVDISSLNDIKKYEVGIIRGSFVRNRLLSAGIKRLQAVNTNIQNLRKLDLSRIDLLVQEELVLAHAVEQYNRSVTSGRRLSLDGFERVWELPPTGEENGLYIAMSKSSTPSLVTSVTEALVALMAQGKLVEVAHWWTNAMEQEFVNIYRSALKEAGYEWVDYTYEGGAGAKMKQLLELREAINNRPHAMQTYMGPALWHWGQRDALIDISDVAVAQEWDKKLPAFINQLIQFEGRYLAAPVNMQRVNWVWLNAKVFRQTGAAPPQTWDEFYKVAEQFRAAGIIPVAIGAEPWQIGTLFENVLLGVGGIDFHRQALIELDPGALGSDTMILVFEHVRKIQGYTDPAQTGPGWVQATQAVIDGRAAMYFMGDWAKSVFQAKGVDYGEGGYLVTPVPGTGNIFLNNTDVFAFPRGKPDDVLAQKALARLIMQKSVQEQFNLAKGSMPARLDADTRAFDKVSKISLAVATKGTVVPSFNFRQTAPEEVHEAIVRLVNHFFHSDMSPEEAAIRLAQDVKALGFHKH